MPGSPENRLAEWMTACVLRIYRQKIGGFDPLRRALGIGLLAGGTANAQWQHEFRGDHRRLCAVAMSQLWSQFHQAHGDRPVRFRDWRVILYGLASAGTVRQAAVHVRDCLEAMDGRFGSLELRVRDELAEIEFNPVAGVEQPFAYILCLLSLAEFHSLFEWLIAQPLPLAGMSFRYDAEILPDLSPPPLPFPISFGASWNGFSFSAAYLDYPVEREAESVLERPSYNFLSEADYGQSSQDFAERVRRIALGALRDEYRLPSFQQVAAEAGLSPATLRRRLNEQGSSYRRIKESCRRELALKMLRYSTLSIEDISARLDYCDSDAFRRAFRGWTGSSPSKLRREASVRGSGGGSNLDSAAATAGRKAQGTQPGTRNRS